MNRHWPFGALMGTDEKARVAVSSLGLDSATADGWRTPPAPETATGVVGLKSGMPDGSAVSVAEAAITVEIVVGVAEAVATVELVVGVTGLGTGELESAPVKEKAWFGSAVLQGASSITFAEVTVKHVPTAFDGDRANGPEPPLNGKV